MLHKPILIGLTILLSSLASYSQQYYPVTNLPVYDGSGCLENPWAGGLNNPQFSPIDLNQDSHMDLFVFDKTGDKVLTFINNGTPDIVDYSYAPTYEDWFPTDLTKWAMIRDYNCDGVPDIWSSVPQGIRVHEGTREVDGSLSFDTIGNFLTYTYPGGEVNILVTPVDFPAIDDIDGDGDLDILTFGIFGTTVEFYENLSMDSTGQCDVTYRLSETCWGKFIEGANDNQIFLGACKKGGLANHGEPGNARHAGSTLCTYDQEGDGDKEILIGDLVSNKINYLLNGGTKDNALMSSIDSLFPVYNTPINLPVFVTTFYMDVNNDGQGDIIASPNAETASQTIGNVFHYKDIDPTLNHNFALQTDSFLNDGMIEVGDHAYPVLFDYNGDGRKDLLVGNFKYFKENSGNLKSGLALYENTGTNFAPEYLLKTRNYMGLNSLNLNNLNATFGDLDGDSDLDMLLGEEDGFIHFMENTSSGGNAIFQLKTPNLYGIDVGQFSVPFLYDVNKDGDLDLIIGRKDGELSYYQNTGDPDSLFQESMANHNFGRAKVNRKGYVDGFSAPHILEDDTTGEMILFVGSEQGFIFRYMIDPDSLLSGSFDVIDTFINKNFGSKTNVFIADVNTDGAMEYMIGTERGGIHLYSETEWDTSFTCMPDTTVDTTGNTINIYDYDQVTFDLYPNPNNGSFNLKLASDLNLDEVQLDVYNKLGQSVYSEINVFSTVTLIDLKHLSSGMYIFAVRSGEKVAHKKFLIE